MYGVRCQSELSISFKMQEYLNKGLECHQRGDFAGAESFYREVLAKIPNQPRALYFLGALRYQMRDIEDSLRCLQKAHEAAPADVQVLMTYADVLREIGRDDDAVPLYRRVLELMPDHVPAHGNMGLIYERRGEYSQALACYEAVLKRAPSDLNALLNIGNIHLTQGRRDEAKANYMEVLCIDPGCAEAHFNLGNLASHLGDQESVGRHFLEAIRLRPDYVEAYINLGVWFEGQGRFENSKHCYEQLRRLVPEDEVGFRLLGNLYLKQSLFAQAVVEFERAVRLNAQDADLQSNLGNAYFGVGQRERAEQCFKRALGLNPSHPNARHMLDRLIGRQPDHLGSEFVRSLFDDYAERFEQDLVQNLEYVAHLRAADRVLSHFGAAERTIDVLDLGCGTGLVGKALNGIAARIVGVDLAPLMVEKALQTGVYVQAVLGDVQEYMQHVQTQSVDAIVATDVFIYVGDLDMVFKEAARILRGGGIFVFSVERGDEIPDRYFLRRSGRYSHSRVYVRNLAAAHGFIEQELSPCVLRKDLGQDIEGDIWVLGCA